ncbi:MAG: HutD family protein [Crocinitomicaceae bacterium]|nr:HutD family protein [Crocinitomicaceae bacterium]
MAKSKGTTTFLTPKERSINRWSGGTTEELYIYPTSAKYAKMNFDFRISIATIEVEESTFTPLPKVSRTTLILDGEIELKHEGQYSKTLKKFESDSYDGGWETTSNGTCTDFNLMTRGKTTGKVETHTLEDGQQVICPKGEHLIIYAFSGRTAVVVKNDAHMLEEGGVLVMEEPSFPIIAKALGESEIVMVSVN